MSARSADLPFAVRVVAIDLGDARTGIAVGDRVTGIASPAGLVEIPIQREGGEALLRGIVGQVRGLVGGTGGEGEVVVGLPLNMDGTEGPRAKAVRLFAARIAAALGCEVVLVDERRTTMQADERMARSGLTHKQKKMRRDAIAAAAVLGAFLEGEGVVGVVGGEGDSERTTEGTEATEDKDRAEEAG
jgi:putative Holliday junction resolvase